jgi:nesprin-1
MELDSHKSVMMSVNIIGGHLTEHSCNEEKSLKTSQRIESINEEWDRTCERATQWQTTLQTLLMQVRARS